MFNNESQPSKIYSYGAKHPRTNVAMVDQQMFLSHKYRNNLVAIELERRKKSEELLREVAPELLILDQEIADADKTIEEARQAIKDRNKESRKRTGRKDEKARIDNLKKDRKVLYDRRKELRTKTFANAIFKARQTSISEEAVTLAKKARAESGLYWGSYLAVEQSMQSARKGAPPKFHSWKGRGKIAVQIQHGISVEDAFACADTRLQIARPIKKWTTAKIRIGSNGREPIWAEIPFSMHRPLPDGKIKWIYLIREKIATSYKWHLQFVVSREEGFEEDHAATGTCGVDVGWRIVDKGLRVACWTGDDGQKGELILPHGSKKIHGINSWSKAEELQSIRDKHFDEMLPQVVDFLGKNFRYWPDSLQNFLSRKEKLSLKQCLAGMSQWKSHERLLKMAILWLDNRIPGDEEIFSKLWEWQRRERHLWQWEAHQRRNAIAWRDQIFREFAAMIRRRYHTIAIEDTKWNQLMETPNPEDKMEQGAREYQRIASVGRLLQFIKEKAGNICKVKAQHTTQVCNFCHKMDAFDAATELVRTCRHCNRTEDQDFRASENLLRVALGGDLIMKVG